MAGWAQIAAYFGFVQFTGGFDDYKSGTPVDYGFKVLTSSDPEEKTKKLFAELANGRLAMMAIIGVFFQEHAKTIFEIDVQDADSYIIRYFSIFCYLLIFIFYLQSVSESVLMIFCCRMA